MSAAAAARTPVIVLPGSGCTPTRECNFYAWFSDALDATRYDARMTNMPDPHVCRERAWLPFIVDPSGPLRAGPGCVVVGHSMGGRVAMRAATLPEASRTERHHGALDVLGSFRAAEHRLALED